MREKKLYVCELCGTEYVDKEKAMACESGHKDKLEITRAEYKSIGNTPDGWPTKIMVHAKDDANFRMYKLI